MAPTQIKVWQGPLDDGISSNYWLVATALTGLTGVERRWGPGLKINHQLVTITIIIKKIEILHQFTSSCSVVKPTCQCTRIWTVSFSFRVERSPHVFNLHSSYCTAPKANWSRLLQIRGLVCHGTLAETMCEVFFIHTYKRSKGRWLYYPLVCC